jgi:hypothetical protein
MGALKKKATAFAAGVLEPVRYERSANQRKANGNLPSQNAFCCWT